MGYAESTGLRARMIDWAAVILTVATLGTLAARLVLAPMRPTTVALTLLFGLGFVLVPAVARWSSVERAGALLVGMLLALLTAVGYVAGGLNAPVLALLPVIGAVAVPVLGIRRGLVATALVAGVLAAFAYLEVSGHRFPQELAPEDFRRARALMLLTSVLVVAVIVVAYERYNQGLRTELRGQAAQDPLTGLANRRHSNAVLRYEWGRCARARSAVSVILFDVDHFKLYNDGYGHQAGDECLRSVADISRGTFRRASDLVARYGGEEFLAILPEASHEAALRVAEDLRAALERRGIVHESAPAGRVTVSVGVATAAQPSTMSSDALLQHADVALYNAKRAGRNRVEGWHQASDGAGGPTLDGRGDEPTPPAGSPASGT